MGSNGGDMEMKNKSSSDPDKAVAQQVDDAAVEDRPPTPPKRDFKAEKEAETLASSEPEQRKKIGSFLRPEFISKPESTVAWMSFLKNILILSNLLIWMFGAALTGIGIWIKVDEEFWDIQTGLDMKQFSTAAYVLIAAGVFIMLIGFVGCYGAYSQSLCLLVVYAVVVLVIILLELAVIILVFTASRSNGVREEIKVKARKAMQDMARDDNQRYFLDLVQAKLECCGIDGSADYDEEEVPHSCTNPATALPREKGCLTAVVEYFESKANILGGVAITVFILQVGALVLTVFLACGIKNAAVNAIF